MKIPKQISPDRIKDAIVEVKYSSKIPFEVAVGMFYKSLDDTYTYTNRAIANQQSTNTLPLNILEKLEIQIGKRPLFYNEKIKIELQPNAIIFNCLKEYITWDIYKPEIEKALTQLVKSDVIESFTRVGVRYISEYPNIDLKDCVKFSFTFGMPEIQSETYTFHSEFKLEGHRVILNLNNKLPFINPKSSTNQVSITPVSNVDIDVIMEGLDCKTVNDILPNIELAHNTEKVVFFNLLTDAFLKSLNPSY